MCGWLPDLVGSALGTVKQALQTRGVELLDEEV